MLDALPRRLRGAIDLFTIHPPYVLHTELKTLPREIREFEPLQSLTDNSDDGLGFVRRLAADAHTWLKPGGVAPVEVGTYSRGGPSRCFAPRASSMSSGRRTRSA